MAGSFLVMALLNPSKIGTGPIMNVLPSRLAGFGWAVKGCEPPVRASPLMPLSWGEGVRLVGIFLYNRFDMYDPKVHNLPQFKLLRRKLRTFPTKAERVLWERIRKESLGKLFRRQFGIANHIVDFFCWKEKLIIEIDGGIHKDQKVKEQDLWRQQDLENLGYRVLRFTNFQVLNNLDSVINKIKISLSNPTSNQNPSSPGGRRRPDYPLAVDRGSNSIVPPVVDKDSNSNRPYGSLFSKPYPTPKTKCSTR
jgi:very-short-patch-repair endonuclease